MIKNSLKVLFKYFLRFFIKLNLNDKNFISNDFGFSRGTPIDRYYLNRFLKLNKHFIKGEGLEFGSDFYLTKYNSGITNFNVFTSDLD